MLDLDLLGRNFSIAIKEGEAFVMAPSQRYTVKPVCLGYLEADLSGFTYMAFPGTFILLDVAYFLISGAPKVIIVDSGSWAALMAKYWPGKATDVITFEDSLRLEGLTPNDVEIIITTHLHHDHIGNHFKCSHAEVYIQLDEWAFARAPHPLQAQYYPPELLDQLATMKIRLIRGDYELFPGIRILHTPGHTPGTQSVCVDSDQGRTVIAGQCSTFHTFAEPRTVLPEDHPFAQWEVFTQTIATDINQSYWSCLAVKRMADVLLPCHGPGFQEATRKYFPTNKGKDIHHV
ncbi:MAG: N-acyl homoserine lactonase family protein [Candidatus Methanomethylicaceae archaeon]